MRVGNKKYIMERKPNVVADKSKAFALRIVMLYRFLVEKEKEFVLSKQILKSGTSIGANIRESKNAQSLLDFISKLSISLKEADETAYWLELLYESGYIDQTLFDSLYADLSELIALLTAIIKNTKHKIEEEK